MCCGRYLLICSTEMIDPHQFPPLSCLGQLWGHCVFKSLITQAIKSSVLWEIREKIVITCGDHSAGGPGHKSAGSNGRSLLLLRIQIWRFIFNQVCCGLNSSAALNVFEMFGKKWQSFKKCKHRPRMSGICLLHKHYLRYVSVASV